MRIDNAGKPNDLRSINAEASRGRAPQEASRGASAKADGLELSRLGTAVRSLALRIVEDDAALRAIRMQDLKQAIAAGRFAPDPEQTAEAMLEHVAD